MAAAGLPATRANGRPQYVAFATLSLAAVGLTGLLSLSRGGTGFFAPYFGSIPPMLAVALVAAVGFVCVGPLHARGWLQRRRGQTVRGVGFAAVTATIFGLWQAGADLLVTRFPKDINVPVPESLLFYPAIAYVVEVLFHALPLALLLVALDWLPEKRKPNPTVAVWLCIVPVAALEPILVHLRTGASTYVAVFVFVFTLVELNVFRRYDFVSMMAFRVVFYLWWHILWGSLRLRWLF